MKYSHNNEEQYIDDFIKKLGLTDNAYVDVGASNGIHMSNTLFLAKKGWNGFCVEYNPFIYAELIKNYKEFTKINFSNRKATPDTILDIFEKNDIPTAFSFLNLDIDGYDYFVLDKILSKYRPAIVCAEINEKIPPPIKFTVLYDDSFKWTDAPFFGQSIQQVQVLCNDHNYSIIFVEYNNVFLVNNELSHSFDRPTVKDVWLDGYLNRPDRKRKWSHNKNFEHIYSLSPSESMDFINKAFIKHIGKYTISYE